jgi:hypothetical protein
MFSRILDANSFIEDMKQLRTGRERERKGRGEGERKEVKMVEMGKLSEWKEEKKVGGRGRERKGGRKEGNAIPMRRSIEPSNLFNGSNFKNGGHSPSQLRTERESYKERVFPVPEEEEEDWGEVTTPASRMALLNLGLVPRLLLVAMPPLRVAKDETDRESPLLMVSICSRRSPETDLSTLFCTMRMGVSPRGASTRQKKRA